MLSETQRAGALNDPTPFIAWAAEVTMFIGKMHYTLTPAGAAEAQR